MSEEKHTPGPWEWESEAADDSWGNRGPTLVSIPLRRTWDEYWGPSRKGPPGNKLSDWPPSGCVVSGWGDDAWGLQVSPADMTLIAAAPDMLAALVGLVEAARHQPIHMDVMNAARAAIAKAEGHSP